jgi:uncharacterized protein (DUF2236 family)
MPLRDRAPDPGLFGPGSVTWRVIREPLLVVCGARALLLQAAHPLIAEGVIEHSSYRSDPWGRLLRTLEWVALCSFGTTEEARASCRQVNQGHAQVQGRLARDHATAEHPPGREYTARDRELLRWVHACFVDTMLVAHDAMIGSLDDGERDRLVREWNAVAALMGVPATDRFQSRAEVAEFVATEVASGRVTPGAGSREVAATVLAPPLPGLVAHPATRLFALGTIGLLPAETRAAYGFGWSPAHDVAHRTLCAGLRRLHPGLPRELRISPAHDWSVRRVRGALSPPRPAGEDAAA